jgi:hypothetical protein
MSLPRRRFLHPATGAAALPAVSDFAWAQAYPSRPITMIVPFATGGLTDVIGRVLAKGMRTSLGGLADWGTDTGLPFDEVAQVLHRSARCHNCTD